MGGTAGVEAACPAQNTAGGLLAGALGGIAGGGVGRNAPSGGGIEPAAAATCWGPSAAVQKSQGAALPARRCVAACESQVPWEALPATREALRRSL